VTRPGILQALAGVRAVTVTITAAEINSTRTATIVGTYSPMIPKRWLRPHALCSSNLLSAFACFPHLSSYCSGSWALEVAAQSVAGRRLLGTPWASPSSLQLAIEAGWLSSAAPAQAQVKTSTPHTSIISKLCVICHCQCQCQQQQYASIFWTLQSKQNSYLVHSTAQSLCPSILESCLCSVFIFLPVSCSFVQADPCSFAQADPIS
jgi:hypothetical protein